LTPPGIPATNQRLLLIAMSVAFGMLLMDETLIAIALPSIREELDASSTELQWVVSAYPLAVVAFLLLGGQMSDRFGSVRMLVVGSVVFAAASFLSGLAPTSTVLILARGIQGVGTALIMVCSQTVISDAYPTGKRERALGIYNGIGSAALMLGPVVGGFLIWVFSWRLAFWINVPIGIAVILVTIRQTRSWSEQRRPRRIDAWGQLGVMLTLTALVTVLLRGGSWGWTSPRAVLLLLFALFGAILLIRMDLRRPERRLLGISLLRRDRTVLSGAGILLLAQAAAIGLPLYGSLYFQEVFGWSAIQTGLALLPAFVLVPYSSTVAGSVIARHGFRGPVAISGSLTSVSVVVIGLGYLAGSYLVIISGMVIFSLFAPVLFIAPAAVSMGLVPEELRGHLSALLRLAQALGASLGLAIMAAIYLAFERGRSGSMDPSEAVDAITATAVFGAVMLGSTVAVTLWVMRSGRANR
jgi:DHA2 family methylenomycin A resistance protein-like MFS transporter